MKRLVQIGLSDSCEYIYVTEPNWYHVKAQKIIEGYPPIPVELYDYRPWQYIGVDMNKDSIDFVKSKYGCQENATYFQALVSEKDNEIVANDLYRAGQYRRSGDGDDVVKVEQKSISLSTLFQKTGLPDVLVVDIEGSELEVFRGYDFKHTPEMIVVEFHTFEAFNTITKIFFEQDYKIFYIEPPRRVELDECHLAMGFLRSDKVSSRIKNLWVYST